MIFTPRVLGVIWGQLQWYGLFMNNPDAPSEEAFKAYYAAANPAQPLSWTYKAAGVTYQYDLSMNQAQVTPNSEPYAGWVDRLNKRLWEVLPPELLDTKDNWKKAWLAASKKSNIAAIWFIIEQGFDVNLADEDGFTALYHAVTPYGGSYKLVKLLVESGADLTLPNNTVDFLIKVGWENVAGNGEASEAMSIAAFLRSVAPGQ